MLRHSAARRLLPCLVLAACSAVLGATRAPPATAGLTAAVVLPADDDALAGVRLGAKEAARTAELLRLPFAVHEVHAGNSADAVAATRALLREHDVQVLIGGADDAAARALADLARDEGVVFLNVGSADTALRLRCTPLAFHIAPHEGMLRDAVIAAGRPDGAVAASWHVSLERFGAGQVNDRFADMHDRSITPRAWAGWMAVKVAWEAAVRAESSAPAAIARHLAGDAIFDGHKGVPLSFHPGTHQLRQVIYVVAGERVIAEIPSLTEDRDADAAALLDRIGMLNGGEPCAPS